MLLENGFNDLALQKAMLNNSETRLGKVVEADNLGDSDNLTTQLDLFVLAQLKPHCQLGNGI